jgi:predicted RNase H-like nuclease (RuvC/YqgF family)
MAPRSPLEIATASVQRLVKEEASYHRELQQQTERIKRLESETGDDENREYMLKQEVRESFRNSRVQRLTEYSALLLKRRRMFFLV